MEKEISQAVIRRMPRYYRYLGELLEEGVERISSNDLSNRMQVTASQIRQDLNNFGGFGQQGYGYNVQFLYDEIGKILGLNTTHNIIVIGAGNLGQAITNYVKFEKLGFVIIALFDVNPALKGKTVRGIEIHMIDEMEDFLKTHDVDIAALTMPKQKVKLYEAYQSILWMSWKIIAKTIKWILQHLLCQKKKRMRQLSILCSLAFMQYGILPMWIWI